MGTEHSEDLSEVRPDIWAVVLCGPKVYLGSIDAASPDEAKLLLEHGRTIHIRPAYEVSVTLIPVRGPDGQPAISKQMSAEPFLLSLEGSGLLLIPTGLSLFCDMKAGDATRYKTLVDQAAKLAMNARAAQSGLAIP